MTPKRIGSLMSYDVLHIKTCVIVKEILEIHHIKSVDKAIIQKRIYLNLFSHLF